MGFFSEDMAPMLGVFEAETTELSGTIEEIASRTDQAGAFSPQDIAELFRCAHTIKGSSAMMGLDTMSSLTHGLEDLFDLLRQDPTRAEGRISALTDYLFSFCDYVADEVERMEDENFKPKDASGLIARMAAYADEIKGAPAAQPVAAPVATEEPAQAAPAPQAETMATDDSVVVKVSFKPDVPMVNARAMVIVRQLGKRVDIRSHIPEDLVHEDAAKTIATEGLLLSIDPTGVEKAVDLMSKNSFVRHIDVLGEMAPTPTLSDAQGGKGEAHAATDKFVTLRWDSVHALQDLAGELLSQMSFLRALANDNGDELIRTTVSDTARMVDDLAYYIDKIAMVPMSAMVPQLSRMVRDMCRNTDKTVSFEVQGGGIDIDRNLYNSIADPLVHIIRNAVDHGIEPSKERLAKGKEAKGKVTLSIQNLGARVAFRVTDDGCGIDTTAVLRRAESKGLLARPAESYTHEEALRMIMAPGLSTSESVTQYSGRGVGMDVVSAVVRDFNGSVEIESTPNAGTTMTLYMPVSVTAIDCLSFTIGPSTFHMPLYNLNKVFTADEATDKLVHFEDSTLFEYDKRQVSVLDMHHLLNSEGEDRFYIVCHSIDEEFVIGVDDVLGQFSCSSKPLPAPFDAAWQAKCPIRNVTIMDDGTVGYVLNAPLLADYAQGRKKMSEIEDQPQVSQGNLRAADAPDMPLGAFVFGLKGEQFAVSVERVVRVSPMPVCSPIPHSLPYLIGLMNDRNHVISVFDLAASVGSTEWSPYVIILDNGKGKNIGLAVTSATGVVDLTDAVPIDDQPEPRLLAANLRTATTVRANPKAEPITILV